VSVSPKPEAAPKSFLLRPGRDTKTAAEAPESRAELSPEQEAPVPAARFRPRPQSPAWKSVSVSVIAVEADDGTRDSAHSHGSFDNFILPTRCQSYQKFYLFESYQKLQLLVYTYF
jgi:hypothetical protein